MIIGIIAGVSWGILLFRAVMSILVIALLEEAGFRVLKHLLPGLSFSSPVADVSGTQVNLVVGDDEDLEKKDILQTSISDFTDPDIDMVQTGGDTKEGHLGALKDSDPASMARAIQTVLSREDNS